MASNFYQNIFYGAGSYAGQSDTDIPQDLKYYRTNIDGVYVFHWGFHEELITPLLPTFSFDLQIASDIAFTQDVTLWTPLTAISYQNGNVRKGFAIPVAARLDKQEQTWYARARCVVGLNTTAWTEALPFIIPERHEVEESEAVILNLPDAHVYGKEDLLRPILQRRTNLYLVASMYGKELDQNFLENFLTQTNNYIDFCRDENLYDNFGFLFKYLKPSTQVAIEYRECVRSLILASLVGGTLDALQEVIRCFSGVTPTLQLIRQRQDFFLDNILEVPVGAINGINNTFLVSEEFVSGSMVVLQNGSPLTSGVDFTEDQSLPGFVMTVPPNPGDTLDVLFKIGVATDPDPLIFDPTDIIPESTLPPPVLWDTNTLAYGLVIIVHNPGMFILPQILIETLVRPLLPAHVKAFFIFE